MTPRDLRRLMALADVRKARDLARLEALLAEDRRLAAEVAELAQTGARDLAEGIAMPLRAAGAAARLGGAAHRRRAAAARGARSPRSPRARTAAAQSLGKHRALENLVENADRAVIRVRSDRAEREAPPATEQRDPAFGKPR